jgi:hypothetical protein
MNFIECLKTKSAWEIVFHRGWSSTVKEIYFDEEKAIENWEKLTGREYSDYNNYTKKYCGHPDYGYTYYTLNEVSLGEELDERENLIKNGIVEEKIAEIMAEADNRLYYKGYNACEKENKAKIEDIIKQLKAMF